MLSRIVHGAKITLGVASIFFGQVLASPSEAADTCHRILGEWGSSVGKLASHKTIKLDGHPAVREPRPRREPGAAIHVAEPIP